jgi:hypothetical protein
MRILFANYGSGTLLTKKQRLSCVISSGVIGFFVGLCGGYLLKNHFWLLTTAALGIASILLCVGTGAVIFLNWSKVDRAASANSAASANIRQNVPRITSQWDYRAKKPIRAHAAAPIPSAETSEVLSSVSFGINNNVWCNDNSLESAATVFMNPQPEGEELRMRLLSEPTDAVCAVPTADEAAVSRYDQSPIDERMVATEDGF